MLDNSTGFKIRLTDCDYIIQIDLSPNGIPFGDNSRSEKCNKNINLVWFNNIHKWIYNINQLIKILI